MTVTTGSTTSLAFKFAIEQLGTFPVGTGSVTVGIAADASLPSAPTQGSGTGKFGPTTYVEGQTHFSGVDQLLGASTTVTVNVSLRAISAFAPDDNENLCATFTPSLTKSADAGDAGVGLSDLFQELSATGTTGTLCFINQNAITQPGLVSLAIHRTGPAVTSAFQSALLEHADGGASDGGVASAQWVGWLSGFTTTRRLQRCERCPSLSLPRPKRSRARTCTSPSAAPAPLRRGAGRLEHCR